MDVFPQPQQDWDQDIRELGVRLAAAALFLVAVLLVGTVGFRIVDPHASWLDALYMTTITLTTDLAFRTAGAKAGLFGPPRWAVIDPQPEDPVGGLTAELANVDLGH